MLRIKSASLIFILIMSIVLTSQAMAGPYSDDMAKCLVESTSQKDKSQLVQWIFSALSLHPSLANSVSISSFEREESTRKAADLFVTLVTDRCFEETKKAIDYEGPESIGYGFKILGEVAAHGLFSSPEVAQGMSSFENYLDKDKLKVLGLEQE